MKEIKSSVDKNNVDKLFADVLNVFKEQIDFNKTHIETLNKNIIQMNEHNQKQILSSHQEVTNVLNEIR
jgi:hypothetical protein